MEIDQRSDCGVVEIGPKVSYAGRTRASRLAEIASASSLRASQSASVPAFRSISTASLSRIASSVRSR